MFIRQKKELMHICWSSTWLMLSLFLSLAIGHAKDNALKHLLGGKYWHLSHLIKFLSNQQGLFLWKYRNFEVLPSKKATQHKILHCWDISPILFNYPCSCLSMPTTPQHLALVPQYLGMIPLLMKLVGTLCVPGVNGLSEYFFFFFILAPFQIFTETLG